MSFNATTADQHIILYYITLSYVILYYIICGNAMSLMPLMTADDVVWMVEWGGVVDVPPLSY